MMSHSDDGRVLTEAEPRRHGYLGASVPPVKCTLPVLSPSLLFSHCILNREVRKACAPSHRTSLSLPTSPASSSSPFSYFTVPGSCNGGRGAGRSSHGAQAAASCFHGQEAAPRDAWRVPGQWLRRQKPGPVLGVLPGRTTGRARLPLRTDPAQPPTYRKPGALPNQVIFGGRLPSLSVQVDGCSNELDLAYHKVSGSFRSPPLETRSRGCTVCSLTLRGGGLHGRDGP